MKNRFLALLAIFSLINPVYAEESKETLLQLKVNQALIQDSAKQFDINPLYLSTIIYTERVLNYSETDKKFDTLLAKVGYNSSVGFCQVKLKTAYFIERLLHDANSQFYAGQKYKDILSVSQHPDEIINKLNDVQHNIQYAAGYLRIIQSYWTKAGFPINDRPDILGTLYSAGLFNNDASVRTPNINPVANEFGKKVLNSIGIVSSYLK